MIWLKMPGTKFLLNCAGNSLLILLRYSKEEMTSRMPETTSKRLPISALIISLGRYG